MIRRLRNFRRSVRASLKERRLACEQARYRRLFTARNLSVPSESEILLRSQIKFPHQRPKNKGALNILSIYHDYNWEGPSIGPSLAAFGQVRHIDWYGLAALQGGQYADSSWMEKMHTMLLTTARHWSREQAFDVIFTYLSGEQATPKLMLGLRELKAPIVNLALNDKELFVGKVRRGHAAGSRDISQYFDLCWTSTEDALEKYVVEGATPLYLPEGANPGVHKPYAEDKIYDVSFVGQCYGNRPEVVSRLRDAGIQVETFGPGWPSGPLSAEEMVRTWSRTRINLGFGGVLGFKKTFCLKGRDFEIPMSGGLYLTEHHQELTSFYDVGREIVSYTDFDDLTQKIRWLLDNPEQAESIRQAGYERARREHSWEGRFEKVFRMLGVLT